MHAILAERFGRCILFYWSSSNCLSSISRNPRTKRRWVILVTIFIVRLLLTSDIE